MAETTKAKDYIKECFSKKMLIQKGIIAFCALVLVLTLSLSFYFWLKDASGEIGTNPFWYISIVWNDGIGFSQLTGDTTAIYVIQSLMFVLLLAIYLFLANDKITASFVALAMFGGLFNLFQRAAETGAHAGCVLDYFKFGFWPTFAVFNWPDMFVVVGIFGFVISYITLVIIEAVNESKQKKLEKAKQEQAKANDEQPKQQQ